MDSQSQTSFIPKKSDGRGKTSRQQGTQKKSLFSILSLIIFIVVILAAVGMFAYTKILEAQITGLNDQLTAKQSELDSGFVNQLKHFDTKINLSQSLLSSHIASSELFATLETLTVKNVQFTSFNLVGTPLTGYTLQLYGSAPSFASLVLQSDVLSENDSFSNVAINNVSMTGNNGISFTVTASINKAYIKYVSPLSGNSSLSQ